MPTQAYPYLVMTDGTDTVVFADGTASASTAYWPPVRGKWGPSIAGIRQSQLAGRGPYADVEEDLSCNIRGLPGNTAADAYANLATLTRLLDKAERWWLRNAPINPVVLRYVPQGSTIHSSSGGPYLQAIVLGRAGSDELNGVELPDNTNDAGFIFEFDDVRVACLRRGAWAGTSDNTGASGAAANCTVFHQTFAASHPVSSPLNVEWGGFNKTATPIIKAGFLCVGSQSSDVQVVEAESGTAAGFTSVADAAALARGGSVLRYTPATTNPATSGNITGLVAIGGSPVAILAAVRNNSATATFLIHANLSGVVGAVSTPDVLIDTSTTQPRLIRLGEVVGSVLTNISLTVDASVTGAGTLDIDYLILVNLRDETCTIVANDDIPLASLATSGAATLFMGYNPVTDRVPLVYAGGTAGSAPGSYSGPLPFQSIGADVYALWAATNGNFWRFTNTSNAIVNITLNVGRYRSYVSPQ